MNTDNIDQVYLNVFKGNNENNIKEENLNEISGSTNRYKYKGIAFVMIFILLLNAFGAIITLLPSYLQDKKIYLSFKPDSQIKETIKEGFFMNNFNIKVEEIDNKLKSDILDKESTLGKEFIYWNAKDYNIDSNISTGYINDILSGNLVEFNKEFCEFNEDHKSFCDSIGVNFN